MLRLLFRLAKDLGRTVAELAESMSWPELVQWIAYYTWEADQSLPEGKRPVRVRTKEQAAAALDRFFKVVKPKKAKA